MMNQIEMTDFFDIVCEYVNKDDESDYDIRGQCNKHNDSQSAIT